MNVTTNIHDKDRFVQNSHTALHDC